MTDTLALRESVHQACNAYYIFVFSYMCILYNMMTMVSIIWSHFFINSFIYSVCYIDVIASSVYDYYVCFEHVNILLEITV